MIAALTLVQLLTQARDKQAKRVAATTALDIAALTRV
jgi:hypothetical protein